MLTSKSASIQIKAALGIMIVAMGMAIVLASCESGGSDSGSSGGSTVTGTVDTFAGGGAFFAPSQPAHGLARWVSDFMNLVIPSARAAVAGVQVAVQGTDLDTTTDDNGFFIISGVPTGDQTMVFTHNGSSASVVVNVPANSTVTMNDVDCNGDNGSVDVGSMGVEMNDDDNMNGNMNGNDNEVENENENENGNDNADNDNEDNGNDNGDNGNDNHSQGVEATVIGG